ncbi:conserved domain protein [Peptoniphilus sp. oral taxon 375 str. F0436]|nr:conserved domain protein [Peptoniphilus sp. oral taxon 375 str. F0436]
MMLYTSVFFQGITKKGINIFLGGSPFLKWVEFNKIRKVEMGKNRKGNVELKVHVFENVFKQIYSLEDEEKIVGLIKNRI